ncbi:hypothetical protein HF325_001349 [Metschnikowia pulcherrima]|uniref:Uncharacterized protein n=1 Tax=Metschnikowia pulcherrima TaxID=27326 RepID=A0A8H7GWJ5_9ASCO|nr:hypothetical protein HF325_001349 [Metschnikowia pulcherrima]
MSDRVARLTEIRRKRKAQKGTNAANEIDASVVAPKPLAEVPSKLNVTSIEDNKTVEKNDQSRKSPDAGTIWARERGRRAIRYGRSG